MSELDDLAAATHGTKRKPRQRPANVNLIVAVVAVVLLALVGATVYHLSQPDKSKLLHEYQARIHHLEAVRDHEDMIRRGMFPDDHPAESFTSTENAELDALLKKVGELKAEGIK